MVPALHKATVSSQLLLILLPDVKVIMKAFIGAPMFRQITMLVVIHRQPNVGRSNLWVEVQRALRREVAAYAWDPAVKCVTVIQMRMIAMLAGATIPNTLHATMSTAVGSRKDFKQ